MTVLLTPTQVFLRLSWANERPASCSYTFVNKKKSAGARSSTKNGSTISGTVLAVNQLLAAAEFMTQEMFQPEISVKNGLDGKIRISRAEAKRAHLLIRGVFLSFHALNYRINFLFLQRLYTKSNSHCFLYF